MTTHDDRDKSQSGGAPFDAFEIGAVAPVSVFSGYTGDDNEVERLDTIKDLLYAGDTVFYTVYGHRNGQGVWAIADFTTYEAALNMAHALAATPANVQIVDMVPVADL